MNKTFKFLILIFLAVISCNTNNSGISSHSLVNPAHLNHLYEQFEVEGKSMAIIHIYSDYPDYKWASESHEGIACVDDVARAAIFYVKFYSQTKDKIYLKKIFELSEFLLYMQAQNGYFYNFLLQDFRINKTYSRSLAKGNWWSWRALWALSEIYPIMLTEDNVFAKRVWNSMERIVNIVLKEYQNDNDFRFVEGFQIPKWLPANGGSDQGATLVLGLLNYNKYGKNHDVLNLIERLCNGITNMQAGDSLQFPFGAYLSWENNWHAWGNVQSYVLLKTGNHLENENYIQGSLMEIDYFYKYLINEKYLCEMKFKKQDNNIHQLNFKKAPQIAYGIRPMIYACLEAFKITRYKIYAEKAGDIAKWFFGDNIARKMMYDPQTGICFDGINDDGSLNLNSGAESTIESLLALLAIEENPLAHKIVMDYYLRKEDLN